MKIQTITSDSCTDLYSRGNQLYYCQYNDGLKYYTFHREKGGVEIAREVFLKAKFGENYSKILPLLEGEDEYAYISKSGEIITCGFRNFYFQWFDVYGELFEKKENIGFDSIYGFDIDDMAIIWYVIPTHDYIGTYSLSADAEINLLKKYNDAKVFSCPESVKIYDGYAYIADMGNHRVIKISLRDYSIEDYMHFEDPVFDYLRIGDSEYVRLMEGLYEYNQRL